MLRFPVLMPFAVHVKSPDTSPRTSHFVHKRRSARPGARMPAAALTHAHTLEARKIHPGNQPWQPCRKPWKPAQRARIRVRLSKFTPETNLALWCRPARPGRAVGAPASGFLRSPSSSPAGSRRDGYRSAGSASSSTRNSRASGLPALWRGDGELQAGSAHGGK